MQTDTSERKSRRAFWIVALITLVVLAIITTIGDILSTNHSDSIFEGILLIPVMPGFIIYAFTTGDIHGWQPGPIGQTGRIVVCTLGSWMFWLPFAFRIYMRRLKRTNKK